MGLDDYSRRSVKRCNRRRKLMDGGRLGWVCLLLDLMSLVLIFMRRVLVRIILIVKRWRLELGVRVLGLMSKTNSKTLAKKANSASTNWSSTVSKLSAKHSPKSKNSPR